nr:carbohydrate binding family 9 domain-containing protein [candidate division Zixibacteria bacterium]
MGKHIRRYPHNPIILTIIIWAMLTITVSATGDYHPVYNPSMHVQRFSGKIVIDGNLDDSGWRGVTVADNFAEHNPGDQTRPPVDTKAMMTYDNGKLYVAFICYDDPTTIRASYSQHDNMGNDDNICLIIDTYGDAAWAYELNVNPLGIQGDYLWSRYGGEDESMDLIWEAMGRITDSGYQIEMAVPFSSLRFPDTEEQVWKVDFWRNHPRDSRRQYSWAAYDRNNPCWACQWGTITGINNVKPGKGIEFLPGVIGFQSGGLIDDDDPQSKWKNKDIDGEVSLGIKYSISSDMTAEATYNPDFSQIESDEEQVDVNTTFALFFSERRPFFQEGSELFNTWLNAVYTRTINDPLGAVKVVGRSGRFSVAYLLAYDENSPIMIPMREQTAFGMAGKSTSNILRVRQTFGEESHFGALFTDRRFDVGGSGTVFGYDMALRFLENYNFELQLLGSYTEELNDPELIDTTAEDGYGVVYFDRDHHTLALDGEKFSGHDLYASIGRIGRHFWFDLDYNEESPTFRADNGFVFMNGTRSMEISGGYEFNFDNGFFDNIEPRFGYGHVWVHETGHFKDEWLWYEVGSMVKSQTYIELGGLISREHFHDMQFNGIWSAYFELSSNFSRFISAGMAGSYGDRIARTEDPPVMGKETDLDISIALKPTCRLKIQQGYEYFKNVEEATNQPLNEGFIYYARLTYQFDKRFYIRLFAQYDDFDETWQVEPLLTYRLNPFSVFYLGATENLHNYGLNGWEKTERQFFFKLQYLFQV